MTDYHPTTLKRFLLLLATCWLTACSEPPPAAPMCRVVDSELEPNAGPARCLIKVDKRLIVIGDSQLRRLYLPGGDARGRETAQCTAHRHTWRQTGFNVAVGPFLGWNNNSERLYECRLSEHYGSEYFKLPLPPWTSLSVNTMALVDPYELELQQWHDPDELVDIRDGFTQASGEPYLGPNQAESQPDTTPRLRN